MAARGSKHLRVSRDTILFVAGLGLTINEAVFRSGERPSLLVLFAAMMGLPFILRADEQRSNRGAAGIKYRDRSDDPREGGSE